MSYGRPISSGHGHRTTRYLWTPSFGPVSPRRKRRRRQSRRRLRSRPAPTSRDWEETLRWALAGRPAPNWCITLMAYTLMLALTIHFPFLLVIFLTRWMGGNIDGMANEAKEDALSSMDKTNAALRISRKTSVDGPPTPDEIRVAWNASRRSLDGKLLAGTLLSNLEPAVDQSYIRDVDGTIVGRRAGIKGWLAANCPDMLSHYKALMSYKALADKLRMVLGVEEPDTLSGVLDFGTETAAGTLEEAVATGDEISKILVDSLTQETTEKEEKTARKGQKERVGAPKSLCIIKDIKLLKSNVEHVVSNVNDINEEMGRRGGGWTMAGLEAVLRGRLGLVWMRRARKRGRAA